MATISPPPTYAPIMEKDAAGVEHFNPIWIKWFIELVAAVGVTTSGVGGGPGGSAAIGGFVVPDFDMLPETPVSRRWEHADTNPAGWNVGGGQMTFNGEFTTTNYFTANPNAHIVVGLRVDTSVIATQPRFTGILMGNVIGVDGPEGAPWAPAVQIESRATGLDPQQNNGNLRFLWPNTWTPRNKLLQDGMKYKLMVRSKMASNYWNRYTRYAIWEWRADKLAWDLIMDTGDVLEHNTWLDYTQQGLVFASVFESTNAPGAWKVEWRNCACTWGPAMDEVSDQTAQLSRYAAQMNGSVTPIGMPSTRLTGSGWGGPNSAAYMAGAPFDWDALCVPGALAALVTDPGAQEVADMICRPLLSIVVAAIGDLMDRKEL